jgi:hypothetical protein
MEIEIIGGSELATPTQAKVMIFGFAPSSWHVTRTAGVNKRALVGFKLFLGIFSSYAAAFVFKGLFDSPLSHGSPFAEPPSLPASAAS